MSRRLAVGLLIAAVLVAGATPIVVGATRPRADLGSLPELGPTPPATQSPALAPPTPRLEAMSPAARITMTARSARLEDYDPGRDGPRPVAIGIEAIGVRAPVVPVGVERRSESVEVPADVDTVGWYRFGPSPGMPGSAVLLGHVDSRVRGAGVFFRLRELRVGDTVTVAFANGSTRSFHVAARRSYPKGELPAFVFGRTGRAMLTLLTCGGSFDAAAGSYSDNVVVVALPRS